ncbi:MAG: beta-galactosidase [Planctomycetota bacterium]
MKIGTYYYPEQWPRDQWERDLDNIVAAGLQLTHFAEFAWHALEPEEGRYEFGWLDEALDLCAQRNLEVILCTPTAVVPQWLLQKNPEILFQFSDGRRIRPGGRRHYSPTSPVMLEHTDRIVGKMAEHFGDRPGVVGWQIDNELSGSGIFDYCKETFDQSEHTHVAFRKWLKEKYGDIETLNAAWGNQFWRTDRTNFEQIRMPLDRRPDFANGHATLDASRFWSKVWADFTRRQVDLLRPHIGDRFTTTNFMSYHADLDPEDVSDVLDVTGIDVYPVASFDGPYETEAEYRTADPAMLDTVYNHMAASNAGNRWALLEVQPGQLNWSGVANRLAPGATKLMLWQAIAKGCEFITVYRWRQPLWGGEMHHETLVKHDGVTLSDAGIAFKEVAAELKAMAPENNATYEPLMVEPDGPVVGIAHELDQQWWTMTVPQQEGWSQSGWVQRWHESAGRLGLDTKIVRPDGSNWADCPVVVLPAVQMIEDDWPGKWRQYVEAGGHLVITCRTAWQNKLGHIHEAKLAEPIHDLIGGEIKTYDGLPVGNYEHVEMGGTRYDWRMWSEQVEPTDAEVWARYADGLNEGRAAVLSAKRGKGRVTFHGVYDRGPLSHAVMQRVADAAGLMTSPLPPRVRVYKRNGWTVRIDASSIKPSVEVIPPS